MENTRLCLCVIPAFFLFVWFANFSPKMFIWKRSKLSVKTFIIFLENKFLFRTNVCRRKFPLTLTYPNIAANVPSIFFLPMSLCLFSALAHKFQPGKSLYLYICLPCKVGIRISDQGLLSGIQTGYVK